ncbi:MAG: hypothetical protein QM280_02720 [Bacteroidota bacterium]|jgi:hypothetical protein|nr:hypothetical protein [Bacteroidota bacterium]OQC34832.1 MAG: hypothetical protein BWX65_00055 [Bacteroidetes bacterium ADurb.Bin057]HHT61916.1 hypothetical protein [Bacteroidales bacterium]HOA46949.1 hypothetical protein [Paludibacteraceae bacterium]HOH70543.1 hypothetical protein [Paludibacteraceae bacterium]
MKILKLFAALCCLAVVFTACEKKDVNEKNISVNLQLKELPSEGGEFKVMVTADAPWKATANKTWITLFPDSCDGDTLVTVTVAANTASIKDAAEALFCMDGKCASLTVTRFGKSGNAVDLGLSVKWASYNVGAITPESYGDYFAWGETEQKNIYKWNNYKYATVDANGDLKTLTKYNTSSSYGTIDNKTVLDFADDVARVHWDSTWRIPTKAELDELRTNCTWIWTTKNGINGYEVKSKTNSNSIFLPAAGCRYAGELRYADTSGYYWSSSLYSDYPNYAFYLYFYSNSVDLDYVGGRRYGRSVRPVIE